MRKLEGHAVQVCIKYHIITTVSHTIAMVAIREEDRVKMIFGPAVAHDSQQPTVCWLVALWAEAALRRGTNGEDLPAGGPKILISQAEVEEVGGAMERAASGVNINGTEDNSTESTSKSNV